LKSTHMKIPLHIGMPMMLAFAQQPTATIQASGYGTINGFDTVEAGTILQRPPFMVRQAALAVR